MVKSFYIKFYICSDIGFIKNFKLQIIWQNKQWKKHLHSFNTKNNKLLPFSVDFQKRSFSNNNCLSLLAVKPVAVMASSMFWAKKAAQTLGSINSFANSWVRSTKNFFYLIIINSFLVYTLFRCFIKKIFLFFFFI